MDGRRRVDGMRDEEGGLKVMSTSGTGSGEADKNGNCLTRPDQTRPDQADGLRKVVPSIRLRTCQPNVLPRRKLG